MLPDFDAVNIEELCSDVERRNRLDRVLENATRQDEWTILTISTWLTTFNCPQPLKLDYTDASPVVHEAIALVAQLTDVSRLDFIADLLAPFLDEIATDDEIIPPDCEFDDGLPNDLGNDPPSLMIA